MKLGTAPAALGTPNADALKSCCAALYESDWARLLLGDSFHPGGLDLTARLGELLDLGPGDRVLDVAAGTGASAIFLAQRFGCHVEGVDFGADMVRQANRAAAEQGVDGRVRFSRGDAERLAFDEETFDAVICECAFCTFPDKDTAARGFARVLRPGGRVGLSDLSRKGALPAELEGLFAWIACIADAQPVERYAVFLEEAGLAGSQTEAHPEALSQMIKEIRTRLLGAELLVKLRKIELPGADFEQARELARLAAQAVDDGRLGYVLIAAGKPVA